MNSSVYWNSWKCEVGLDWVVGGSLSLRFGFLCVGPMKLAQGKWDWRRKAHGKENKQTQPIKLTTNYINHNHQRKTKDIPFPMHPLPWVRVLISISLIDLLNLRSVSLFALSSERAPKSWIRFFLTRTELKNWSRNRFEQEQGEGREGHYITYSNNDYSAQTTRDTQLPPPNPSSSWANPLQLRKLSHSPKKNRA